MGVYLLVGKLAFYLMQLHRMSSHNEDVQCMYVDIPFIVDGIL